MKISSQEEYGIRILLRIARNGGTMNMSIPVLSQLEGLSPAYVGKLTGLLRKAGFINSNPGNVGGYILSMPASEININQVLKSLGGSLYNAKFCKGFTGANGSCVNAMDCSIRSLWRTIQTAVDKVLNQVSLEDLIKGEKESVKTLMSYL
mgnify:FL=1